MQDPNVDIHNSNDVIIASNDDFVDSLDAPTMSDFGLGPGNDLESAVFMIAPPGAYTAIVSGIGGAPTGVALVEVYNLQ